MDASAPTYLRRQSADVLALPTPALDRVRQNPKRDADAAHELQRQLRARQLSEAFAAGKQQGSVDMWLAGARIGCLCGLLLGLAVGCGGAIGWISLARAFA